MQRYPFILVADRNPHIRRFVARELEADGYGVHSAANVSQLIKCITLGQMPDLLILDPNLPDGDAQDHIRPLLERYPELPVIFHCLASDIPTPMPHIACTVVVEKSADSIDIVKRQINLLLKTAQRN